MRLTFNFEYYYIAIEMGYIKMPEKLTINDALALIEKKHTHPIDILEYLNRHKVKDTCVSVTVEEVK